MKNSWKILTLSLIQGLALQYSVSAKTLMLPCPAGSFCPRGSKIPTICPEGHFCPPGVAAPTKCSEGDCPEGSVNPVLCPDGKQSVDGKGCKQIWLKIIIVNLSASNIHDVLKTKWFPAMTSPICSKTTFGIDGHRLLFCGVKGQYIFKENSKINLECKKLPCTVLGNTGIFNFNKKITFSLDDDSAILSNTDPNIQ